MADSGDKKLLVVFGATGQQGGSVIRAILGDEKAAAKFSLRGITRDPSKPSAKALAEKGVECVSVRTPPPTSPSNMQMDIKVTLLKHRPTYTIKNLFARR